MTLEPIEDVIEHRTIRQPRVGTLRDIFVEGFQLIPGADAA